MALAVSIAVVVIAGIIGLAVALIAGYRGGRLDAFLMRTTDASLAFPVLLFAIVVVGVFGPSTTLVVIILAIAFWPSYARVLRSEVLHLKTMDYVTRPARWAARAVGWCAATSCRTSCRRCSCCSASNSVWPSSPRAR